MPPERPRNLLQPTCGEVNYASNFLLGYSGQDDPRVLAWALYLLTAVYVHWHAYLMQLIVHDAFSCPEHTPQQ